MNHMPLSFPIGGQRPAKYEIEDRIRRWRAGPELFAVQTVTQLRTWSDDALDALGEIPLPMNYNAETDRFEVLTWAEAVRVVGDELDALENPDQLSVFAGPAISKEIAFLLKIFLRAFRWRSVPPTVDTRDTQLLEPRHRHLVRAVSHVGERSAGKMLVDAHSSELDLAVHIDARVNRNHLVAAKHSVILPAFEFLETPATESDHRLTFAEIHREPCLAYLPYQAVTARRDPKSSRRSP
ncbi:hypothetical protein PY650_14885 [Rhizobium calliandrae]|uniref:Uncharacterized protein n=1 Tax=Rhizobium calliandrae TaxID=1312182 RepID=A0ABT7KG11_9HYPH|nr:hypothetical protein [Rhizobium calliandrae]MDL2406923.1 hypothetical protein [Rhizobium calliandrae]